jgi:uncharacterized HAD superfamily protein
MEKKIFCFDIDGTICTNTDGVYDDAKPMKDRINKLNDLYYKGHEIILFTARGSTTGIDWSAKTKEQMDSWGVKYHKLIFGKPFAHVFIDDRAVRDVEWFGE